MNRGFNYLMQQQQGNRNNVGGQNQNGMRDRPVQQPNNNQRYDNFGNNNNNINRFGNTGGGHRMPNQGGSGMGGGNWNNVQHQPNQMGLTNQHHQGPVSGPMLTAALQQQQQNIINALMTTQGGKGLLAQANQNMSQMNNRQQRMDNSTRPNHGRRDNRRGGAGGGGPTRTAPGVGDKRKNNAPQGGFNKQARKQHSQPKEKVVPPKVAKTVEQPPKEVEIEIPDDQVIVPESIMENIEKLRSRTDVDRNVVDEDVAKLQVFSFTGKGYQCLSCGLLLVKEKAFTDHLQSKNHVLKVIDARTAKKYQEIRDVLDIDLSSDDWFLQSAVARDIIIKQSKVHMKLELETKRREEAMYNKTPSNFFKFNMELRKSVVKKDDEVIITSLVESNVKVKDFTGDKFFGCEFVRAVTGFHCRLCSINIREAKGVIPHINSKLHKTNYDAYVKKNPQYEKTQKEQNTDLHEIMEEHEGKSVVLAESANVEGSQFLSQMDSELVRIPHVMQPELKKAKDKEDKAKKDAEEKEKDVPVGDQETTEKEESTQMETEESNEPAEDVAEEASEDVAEEASEDVAEEASEDVDEEASEDVAEEASEDVAEEASEDVAEEESLEVPEEDTAEDDTAVDAKKEDSAAEEKKVATPVVAKKGKGKGKK